MSISYLLLRTRLYAIFANSIIRYLTSAVGIFPSADAYTRLVTTYLMEYAEDWSASRAYLSEQSIQAILQPAA